MRIVEVLDRPDMRELMKHRDSDQPVRPGVFYHATTESRLPSILHAGLQPRAENLHDNYDPRIYLTVSEETAVQMAFELRKAILFHKGQKRSWREGYAILKIAPLAGHPFYRDGYSNGGIYTDQPIPPAAISVVGIIDGEALMAKNWPDFWNWYFWKKTNTQPATTPRWPADHRYINPWESSLDSRK